MRCELFECVDGDGDVDADVDGSSIGLAAFWLVYSNWNLYIYANSHKYTMSCWPSWLSFWQFVVFLAIKDAVKLPTLLAMNELQIAASAY